MAEDPSEKINEGKIDLVPMIDCIMLLLLFFILTTKFTAPEKAIASVLPTDKGQSAAPPSKPVDPPKQINIVILPEGYADGYEPSQYQAKLLQDRTRLAGQNGVFPTAYLRVGGSNGIKVEGQTLNGKNNAGTEATISGIHGYIEQELGGEREKPGVGRKEQDPIVINCFSGLSWKFALVTYDAVRAYEIKKAGAKMGNDPKEWDKQREVNFAPPRIRNYSVKELGEELYEEVHLK
jgi:hypothetical protein